SLPQPAPAITGPVTPAIVNQGADSITHYLHYPKATAAEKMDGAVQFYCDLLENGSVESIHALVANNDVFKNAVQTALDWGRFTPATVNGQPVRVYVGGTVLFLHQNGEPVIVVSLATHDRDRVGKLTNYIQPQLIGGLRHTLQKAISSLTKGILVGGRAEAVVSVDATGKVTGTSNVSENPKGSGLGNLLDGAVKSAQFTPAYENGTKAAGAINVVANFGAF
ncbi:MAG: energy transducer TonB, partial [Verrucomicrobiota bacterium]|nr:energy transducer TonB [Verrucomicrobiota bacterium]